MLRVLIRPTAGVIAAAVLAAATIARADTLRGQVVAIADGDTVTVLDAGKQQHRIRLNGIDAPEAKQPFSQVARQHLASLVFGREVTVDWVKLDRYGRKIGTVLRGETNANLELLRAGLAWYYREYERDVPPRLRPIYAAAETEARAARRGLWQEPSPQAPWAFRNPEPASAPTPRGLLSSSGTAATVEPGPVRGNRASGIYHVPGCPDYERIAERNRVYFSTEAEAGAAGFRKARNCS